MYEKSLVNVWQKAEIPIDLKKTEVLISVLFYVIMIIDWKKKTTSTNGRKMSIWPWPLNLQLIDK